MTTTNIDIDDEDIVQELRDWAFIANGVQGRANLVMLSGTIFSDAACEIETLRKHKAHLLDAFLELKEQLSEMAKKNTFLSHELKALQSRLDYA
jgi:hypothetical protein